MEYSGMRITGTPCYHSGHLQSSSSADFTRRKVLIAAPFPPGRDSLHGGAQVIGRLVDELADIHSLAVLYLKQKDEPPMEAALAERCALVEEVRRPGGQGDPHRFWRWPGALVRGYPMWAGDWRVPAFGDRLRSVVGSWAPDIVQFEFHIMAQYAEAANGLPAILVEHEPGAAAARDRWQFSHGWRQPLLARDMRAWLKYERDRLARFDAVVCFTERDRRELLGLKADLRVEVIPPRGPSLKPATAGRAQSTKTILFVGNFTHPPNADAAMRLAGSIFPLVRERHPDAVLKIVGDAPPDCLRRLAGRGVVITGRVADPAPYLDEAAVIAAPLRLGGGIRIKVMDALFAAKAIVASPLAAEGLNVRDGHELVLADTDQEFAGALSALLSESPERDRLSTNARQWAEAFGTPGRVAAAFGQLYAATRIAREPASHTAGGRQGNSAP